MKLTAKQLKQIIKEEVAAYSDPSVVDSELSALVEEFVSGDKFRDYLIAKWPFDDSDPTMFNDGIDAWEDQTMYAIESLHDYLVKAMTEAAAEQINRVELELYNGDYAI